VLSLKGSNLNGGYRITAYVLRFVNQTRKFQTVALGKTINPEEYSTVQTVYCRPMWKQHFPSELQVLKEGKTCCAVQIRKTVAILGT